MTDPVEAMIRAHEANFSRGLAGEDVAEAEAALFTDSFLSASPRGVVTGKNDEALKTQIGLGFEHYRRTGAKRMTVRSIDITPIDDMHSMARVGWGAVYADRS